MRIPTLLVDLIAALVRLVASPKKKPTPPRQDRQAEIERAHQRNRK